VSTHENQFAVFASQKDIIKSNDYIESSCHDRLHAGTNPTITSFQLCATSLVDPHSHKAVLLALYVGEVVLSKTTRTFWGPVKVNLDLFDHSTWLCTTMAILVSHSPNTLKCNYDIHQA
jgi:hypothetical protein